MTEPVAVQKPTYDPDTITLKRSHFLALLFVLAILAGVVLGYGGSLVIQQSRPTPIAASVLQGSQSELFATPNPPSVDNDPAFGPEDAKVTMIEFSDFQCSFCKEFFDQTYPRLKHDYGDTIRFVYRDFPMTNVHPEAQAAAEAAECAREQGRFWEYHDALFTHQDQLSAKYYFELAQQLGLDQDTFGHCLRGGKYTLEVANDFGDGLNSGVQGTPTFYINGRMVVGAQPYDVFKQVIDEELAK